MKILEYINESMVKPIGGPCGYVYNLTNDFPDKEQHIFYLKNNNSESKVKRFKRFFPKFVVEFGKAIKENRFVKSIIKGDTKIENIDNYDIIHFHSAFELEKCKKELMNFKGKVLLTIHTPIPPFKEPYLDYNSKICRFLGGKSRMKKYKTICDKALMDCDYLVYPCPEAEESYFEMWDGYSEKRKMIDEKVVFLPTGCVQKQPKFSRNEIRIKLGVNNDDFLVCYAGRHSESKGYDKLQKLAKNMVDSDVEFIICGKQGPLFAPNLSNWKEIGWTSDADSYINASNIFVLPNKSTYFDLVFLEVLSIGKIIVASNTGGNKYFSKFNDSGIFLYNSLEEAQKIIEDIKKMPDEKIHILEKKNKDIYERFFSKSIFSANYCQLYKDISQGKKPMKLYGVQK